MSIINKMEQEAQAFMKKRKNVELARERKMISLINQMYKEIYNIIRRYTNINISQIPLIIMNELKPIIDRYKIIQKDYVNEFMQDDFKIGQDQSYRLLSLSNEEIPPLNTIEDERRFEEVLLALLLFGEDVIERMHNDLASYLQRDMTSIYIMNKNKDAEKEIDTNNNSTLNTILSGTIISGYINSGFKNITNRAEMTSKNESNRALNHGMMMAYLTLKLRNRRFSNMMVKWVEVRDERLCQYCRDAANGGDLGNGVYDINEITPPPIHSRCRCILVPFLPRWE